jgi:serine/threonine-protein kinase
MGIKLEHPGIVRAIEFLKDSGRVALVMELVEGQSMDEMIGTVTGPIPWSRAQPLFQQLLDAVGFAHDHGVVHRDLKPENIIVGSDGALKVLDFGIAKDLSSDKTKTGTGMGTVDYMAPEQYLDAKAVDHRADIYALGMTLYEMVAGRLPWDASSTEFGILEMKKNGVLPPPTEFYPDIPAHVVTAITQATQTEVAERISSTKDFSTAMSLSLEKTEGAAPVPASSRTMIETSPPEFTAVPAPAPVSSAPAPASSAPAPVSSAPSPSPPPRSAPPPQAKSSGGGGNGLVIGLVAVVGLAVLGVGAFYLLDQADSSSSRSSKKDRDKDDDKDDRKDDRKDDEVTVASVCRQGDKKASKHSWEWWEWDDSCTDGLGTLMDDIEYDCGKSTARAALDDFDVCIDEHDDGEDALQCIVDVQEEFEDECEYAGRARQLRDEMPVPIQSESCHGWIDVVEVVLTRDRTEVLIEASERLKKFYLYPPGKPEAFQLEDARSGEIFNLTGNSGAVWKPDTNYTGGYPMRFRLYFEPVSKSTDWVVLVEGSRALQAESDTLWRCDGISVR